MADIITNTLQIGSNNLVLRDADAQEQLVTVKDGLNYGLKTNILPLSLGTTTRNGVTLTKNSDGSYTANGTATAQANFKIGEISAISGDFMITGCPSGGGGSTYSIEVQENGTWKYSEKGSGKQISVTDKTLALYVVIKSGYSANSVVFKPQITADLNATYNDFYPSGIYADTYFNLLKKSYLFGGVIPANTDLNDVKAQGIYNISRNLTYSNFPYPVGTPAILHVYYMSATTVYQIVVNMNTGKILARKYVSGWGSWEDAYNDYGYKTNVVSISHRGTRTTRPDSTSIAYINARMCGFKYAEGDLQRTLDGHYVIGHEDDIYDRTGVHKLISQTNLAELKTIDFGSYLFANYSGQAILTLEEFLDLCNNLGMTPVLDFKTKTSAQVSEILSIIDAYGLPIYNINGSLDTLKYVLANKPDQFVRRSYDNYSNAVESEITSLFNAYPNANFMVAYYIAGTGWTDTVLKGLVDRGIPVCPYEINSGTQWETYCSGKYYIHNIMVGSEFDPSYYASHRDNNILVSS